VDHLAVSTTVSPRTDNDPDVPNPSEVDERSDLGLGRLAAQQARGRFLSRDGVPTSRKYGLGAQRTLRFYRAALNAGWPQFVSWTVGAVLLLNGAFALIYRSLGANGLRGGDALGIADPFLQALVFSMGVFTTNGGGPMYAVGVSANWVVIIESLIGMLAMLTIAGLLIARLTRPRARIRFSESAIIAPYEGGRGLMFRMVNVQPGELSDVRVRINLAWFETIGGVRERNFHQLALERDAVELFTLHWTVVHPITADSPLAGVTPDILRASEAEFLIHVSAHEETFATRVTARASYLWDEVRWDVKFASIFAHAPDGVLAIDVERLSRTEHLEDGATRSPSAVEGAVR
jgi:inward rectifier potassium channel